jgi:hypothetical protein
VYGLVDGCKKRRERHQTAGEHRNPPGPVGEKAKETDAFDKTSKRRAAIDRALGGNPLGRSLDAPKPLDMTPWASHDIGKSVMSKFF